jgi:hypothetical protein
MGVLRIPPPEGMEGCPKKLIKIIQNIESTEIK